MMAEGRKSMETELAIIGGGPAGWRQLWQRGKQAWRIS